MRDAGRVHERRYLLDQIEQYRQIVRRKIPDHIDIALKEPEVEADRCETLERSYLLGLDKVFYRLNRPCVEIRVIHHQHETFFLRIRHQALCVAEGSGKGFFDEHMFPRSESRAHQWPVGTHG